MRNEARADRQRGAEGRKKEERGEEGMEHTSLALFPLGPRGSLYIFSALP
jgi:hypothetical protein